MIKFMHNNGVRGQKRDFDEYIDVNLSAIDTFEADQGFLLSRMASLFSWLTKVAYEVMEQPDIIKRFNQYKTAYAKEHEMEFADDFDISENAIKKQARTFTNVIKLDKNFHIYIHGNRDLIEQGEDKKGKFYKVYYREENWKNYLTLSY